MIRFISTFLLLAAASAAYTQHWERMDTMHLQDSVDAVFYDNLSSRYVLSGGTRLYKVNSRGATAYFQQNRLGPIGQVDVTDPMKVLIFYPVFQTLLTLDNAFSQTGKLNFAGTPIGTVGAVCRAVDNQIWIYDLSNRSLDKIDAGGNILVRGIPNYTVRLDASAPLRMWQAGDYVFLWQMGQPVYQFDNFGKFIKELELPLNANLIGVSSHIYYISDGDLRAFDFKQFSMEPDKVLLSGILPREKLAVDFTNNIIYKYDHAYTLHRWIP